MVFIGKLRSLTKSKLEKRVHLTEIQKAHVGMKFPAPRYPYIQIQQFITNCSEIYLKISRIDVSLKVNDRFLDSTTQGLKVKMGTGNVPPNEPNFSIEYETARLNQVIPDFEDHDLEIEANGKVELQSRTTKIQKDVGGVITIEPSEWT